MMIFRVLDIETIPDLRFWSKAAPNHKLVPYTHLFGSMSTPAVITEPAFPPPQAHRVVAISWVDVLFNPTVSPKYQFREFYTSCRWDHDPKMEDECEKELLIDFRNSLAALTAQGDMTHFVSWNGRTFDLPVISLRSLLHKIQCRWYYEGKDVRYRYSTEGHNDLMDFLSGYGACRPMSLVDACHLVGLPGKLDMTGASVESLYQSTQDAPSEVVEAVKKSVATYCLQDSIQTALLFVLSRFHIGKVDRDSCNAILDTFRRDDIAEVIKLDFDRLKV